MPQDKRLFVLALDGAPNAARSVLTGAVHINFPILEKKAIREVYIRFRGRLHTYVVLEQADI